VLFYVPHLLRHRTSAFKVISERPMILTSKCRVLDEGTTTTYFNVLGLTQPAQAVLELTTFWMLNESVTNRLQLLWTVGRIFYIAHQSPWHINIQFSNKYLFHSLLWPKHIFKLAFTLCQEFSDFLSFPLYEKQGLYVLILIQFVLHYVTKFKYQLFSLLSS
jgi:hypothetical protein